MDRFKEQRDMELQNMIDERKAKWAAVKARRDEIESEIGKLQAQIMFRDSIKEEKNQTYNEILAKKEKLLKEHQRHIEDNKSLAETLDKEILLLEELKCKKIDE